MTKILTPVQEETTQEEVVVTEAPVLSKEEQLKAELVAINTEKENEGLKIFNKAMEDLGAIGCTIRIDTQSQGPTIQTTIRIVAK